MTPVRLQAHRTVPHWLVAVSGIKANIALTLLKRKKKQTLRVDQRHYNGAAANGLLAAVS